VIVALFILISSAAQAGVVNPSVLGPSNGASTVSAFSLWGDSAGGQIVNSPVLLDQSLWTAGQTATIQLPAAGAFNRSWSLPNIDGAILVNGSGQSITSMFLNSTNVTWFSNADVTKLLKFDITSFFATGKTVTLFVTSPSAATAGSTGTINFPTFPAGSSSITLMSTTGGTYSGALSTADVTSYLDWEWKSDSTTGTPAQTERMWSSATSNTMKVRRIDGSVFNINGYSRAEIDFGSSPLTEKSFTITNADLVASDSLVSGKNNTIDAKISRGHIHRKNLRRRDGHGLFFCRLHPRRWKHGLHGSLSNGTAHRDL
jgi:hypothetical protein